jgi:hypothetical protein
MIAPGLSLPPVSLITWGATIGTRALDSRPATRALPDSGEGSNDEVHEPMPNGLLAGERPGGEHAS